MIKAVFFDIDGTLVSFSTHRIPDSALDAIRQLKSQGIKVFIATGRHWRVMNNLSGLEFDGYITLNGSCCYAGRDRLIYRQAIPGEDIRSLVEMERGGTPFPCIFVRERDMFINFTNEHTDEIFRMLNFPEPPLLGIEAALESEIFQLIGFFGAGEEKEVMAHLPGCEATRWNPLFTDIVPLGGSKRIGMEKILAWFGIDREECMAFGDGGNDVPMLEYAGIGVAMGNASEEVKCRADYITASVDEDGIARALEHFDLIGKAGL